MDGERRALLQRTAALIGAGAVAACGGGGGDAAGTPPVAAGPTPAPAPAPVTTPSPAPPSPSPVTVQPDATITGAGFEIRRREVRVASLIVVSDYFDGGRYQRFQRLTVLEGASATIPFYGYSLAAGGDDRALRDTEYRLLVDGVERARTSVAAGALSGRFTLDLQSLAEGWHVLDVVGNPLESCPQWPVYVKKGARAVMPATMPVSTGTHGLLHGGALPNYYHFVAQVPTRFSPTLLPLPARETPPFDTALPRRQLVQVQWVPARSGDVHRTCVSPDGVLSTHNVQPYFWSGFISRRPNLPLLDGPRGQATVVMPTHLQFGRLGKIYFTDPWRVGKVQPDGSVQTLAGWRHRTPPSFWDASAELDLVGDWSAIPAERQGFHELWGMAWDPASLALNDSAAPIGGEQPHAAGPRLFVTDSQNHRVCLLTFAPDSREVPPKVTEFITGLSDPWDLVCVQGELIVSERTGHRISVFDARTGARLRTLLSGQALAGVGPTRFVTRGVDLEVIRQQDCVAPEGLYVSDGWLYFGSVAMGQVRRVPLAGGAVEVVCEPKTDSNSNFMKVAVSDGSFGPRGTVFVATWSNNYFGYPAAFLPGGERWHYLGGAEGPGGPWGEAGYATAVGVGQGKMACGSSAEGLLVHSQALPGDTPRPAAFAAGEHAWASQGFELTHGVGGFGFFGLPLPWGVSPEIDAYLAAHGHAR